MHDAPEVAKRRRHLTTYGQASRKMISEVRRERLSGCTEFSASWAITLVCVSAQMQENSAILPCNRQPQQGMEPRLIRERIVTARPRFIDGADR
jgi:hypothetical protein